MCRCPHSLTTEPNRALRRPFDPAVESSRKNLPWLPDDPGSAQEQPINTLAERVARQLTQPLDQSTYDPASPL